jgi:hypothetical protein
MTWRKHNRHVSDQQFSDGTTIDGSRVEDALQDLEDHVNEVPKGDIKQRFMQTQIVAGYSPHAEAWTDGTDVGGLALDQNVAGLGVNISTAVTGTMFPFMPVYNSASNLSQIAPVVAPTSYTNPHRFKGYQTPGIEIEPTNGSGFEQNRGSSPVPTQIYETDGQYAWEMSWAFRSPVVVANVSIFLMTDDHANAAISAANKALMPFRNDFVFDNPPIANPPYTGGSPSEDLCVQLLVDDAFMKEDRSLTDINLMRHSFQITKENVSSIVWTTHNSATDMEPTLYPGGNPKGCVIDLDCNVSIPEESRARLAIIIPKYDLQQNTPGGVYPRHGGWRGCPWFRQYYTVCVTLLEEIK